MNKTEFIADLKSKFESVSTPKLAHPEAKYDGGKWYEVDVLETEDNGALYRSIHFYVIDEGLSTEKAYYKKDQVNEKYWKIV